MLYSRDCHKLVNQLCFSEKNELKKRIHDVLVQWQIFYLQELQKMQVQFLEQEDPLE